MWAILFMLPLWNPSTAPSSQLDFFFVSMAHLANTDPCLLCGDQLCVEFTPKDPSVCFYSISGPKFNMDDFRFAEQC